MMVLELEPMSDASVHSPTRLNGHAVPILDVEQTASPAPPARKRRRPALSCLECRRRKVKCDRNFPCNHCISSKHDQCMYDESAGIRRESRVSPSVPKSQTVVESHQLDATEDSDQMVSGPYISLLTSSKSYGSPKPTRLDSSDPPQNVRELTERVRKLEHQLQDSLKTRPISAKTTPYMRGSMSKARLYGQSHWMSLFEHFDLIQKLKTHPGADKTSELFQMLSECKKVARAFKALVPAQVTIPPDFNALMPTRDICDELVQAYFRTFESIYRVLHEPTFYKEYYQYWMDPSAATHVYVAKLLLVMAIGSIFYQDKSREIKIRMMSKQWVYVAQTWLYGPFEKSRLNFGCLQAHCLLLLARQICSVGADLVWISEGTLIRIAMQMGLHRDPKFFPKYSVLEAELRRRLWATILELNIQSSLDSGMPPLISLDDFDCEPPANINDSDIDESTTNSSLSQPLAVYTQCSMQILLSRSLPTRVEIARLLNEFRSDPTYEETLALGTKINSQILEIKRFMETTLPRPSVLHQNLLDLHNRRFLLSLHIPFAVRAKADPHYYFSRKIVLDTSMHLLTCSGTNDASSKDPDPKSNLEDDFTRLRILADGVFRGAMHALVAFCLEYLTQVQEESDSATSSSVPRATLRSVLDDTVQLYRRRLEYGETNVKGYVFESMIQAQIIAMETGQNAEQAILDAAKRATSEGFQFLQNNLNRASRPLESAGSTRAPESQLIGMGWDMNPADPPMDFDIPDSWLFSSWEDINSYL